ncbi:MAG: hypothetical protein COB73_00875 [Flavobacteriaceae bacterium]|nr:MAG: hypothetical protein COB73_00875 [Flavobacteriaceae bacterium]
MSTPLKTYNIIGTSFTGVMVFKYDLNGILVAFELQDADELKPVQVKWLFSHFPYKENEISHFRAIRNFTVTEGDFDLTFDMFWDAYKHKVKREMSVKAWSKLSGSDKMKALVNIKHYDGYLARKRNMEKAHASTYLNQKYFNDQWGSAS